MILHLTIDLRAVLLGLALSVAVAAVGIPFAVSLADDGTSTPSTTAQSIALSTAFNFQGRLSNDGLPANGTYDIQARLYADADATEQVPGTTVLTIQDAPTINGLFSIQLDFGSTAFDGQSRYLEIRVRPGSESGGFSLLSPLQPLSPVPYAMAAPWSGIYGKPSSLDDGDQDTLYTAAESGGLSLNGTAFSADTSYLQRRIHAGCAVTSSIRAINADGSVVCETALESEIGDRAQADNAAWSLVCPGCDLRGIQRVTGMMTNAYFPGADLSPLPYGPNGSLSLPADLSDARLQRANFAGANLRNADLSTAFLTPTEPAVTQATFGADFSNADLSFADLSGSDARGIVIAGATLAGTNLANANLRYAHGEPADIAGANWDLAVCPDGVQVFGSATCEGHWLP